MSVTLSRKTVVCTLAGVLIAAGLGATAGTSVSYAAGASASVVACANGKHQLGVASKKGKCGKGFKKVTLAQQGPRGPQGPRGVQGARGAQGLPGKQGAQGEKGAAGPGAVKLLLQTSDSGNTSPLQVGSFAYQLGCDTTGTSANATVYVSAKAGVTGALSTQYSYANNDSLDPTTKFYRTTFSTTTQFHSSATNGVQRTYIDSMRVVGSDGTVQLISIELNADGRSTPAGERCVIAGSVTPAY